jgi:hypothetical protein
MMLPIHEIDTDTIQCQPEVETPVEVSEIAVPLGPFARASLAAELAAREAVETIAEVALPPTLSSALARQREVSASVPTDAKGHREKTRQLQTLAAHIHRLSQGPTAPSINHKEFWQRDVPASALAYVEARYPKSIKARKARTQS